MTRLAVALGLAALAAGPVAAQTVMRLEGAKGVLDLPAGAVAKAEVADMAAPTVYVSLVPDMAPALAEITGQHLGQTLRVLVCGRTVAEPVVRERIASGALAMSAGSPRAAQRMADALTGTLGCLEAAALGFDD